MAHRPPGRRALSVVLAAGTAVITAAASIGPAFAVDRGGAGGAAPAALGAVSPAVRGTPLQDGRYVVTLREPAAAAYGGGIAGLPATAPAPEQQLRASSTSVQLYRSYLTARQDALLSSTV